MNIFKKLFGDKSADATPTNSKLAYEVVKLGYLDAKAENEELKKEIEKLKKKLK